MRKASDLRLVIDHPLSRFVDVAIWRVRYLQVESLLIFSSFSEEFGVLEGAFDREYIRCVFDARNSIAK